MTTVRIAHVEPRPGRLPDGGFQTRGFLVVLTDDAGRRAVPIWLREPAAEGARQVTAGLGPGLAMAAAARAPVRLADVVLDRVAAPVPGDDLLTPFLDRVLPVAQVAFEDKVNVAAGHPASRDPGG